jgi:hypothetical protein
MNPTLNCSSGIIHKTPMPLLQELNSSKKMVELAQLDWDAYETSWDFALNPIIRTKELNLEQAFNTWQQQNIQ